MTRKSRIAVQTESWSSVDLQPVDIVAVRVSHETWREVGKSAGAG